ncbi:MAG: radical SAM family heme chaperone HemW [Candidatus Limiplasma sp.]|nr:radical SAM family heme chaperone HemW [Candidatus Limiplasma sp.]
MQLSLYLHIPFCKRKCFYCDFCSAAASRREMEEYCAALREEIRLQAKAYGHARVNTVFIGGGTPSLLPASLMDGLLEELGRRFCIQKDAEFTMEANPGTLHGDWLTMAREHGVNRLSLGVQAAQEPLLGVLGRIHTFREAVEAVALAKEHGFSNLNVDVMFGLPGQSLRDYLETLARVAALEVPHISAYSLILEEGTPLADRIRAGELAPPAEDEAAAMYESGRDWLEAHGYRQYEISNFAKPGYACKHNLGYWRGGWYLGMGVSGAGMLPGPDRAGERGSGSQALYLRRENVADRAEYQQRLAQGELPLAQEHRISREEAMFEAMMLGLRTVAGVDPGDFESRFGQPLQEAYGKRMEELISQGLAWWRPDTQQGEASRTFALTPKGLLLQNQALLLLMD